MQPRDGPPLIPLKAWSKRKSSPTNPLLFNDNNGIGQLLIWNRFEGSSEAVYRFLFTVISASEEYQARPFSLRQSQKPRVIQISRYYHSLFTASALQNLCIRSTS